MMGIAKQGFCLCCAPRCTLISVFLPCLPISTPKALAAGIIRQNVGDAWLTVAMEAVWPRQGWAGLCGQTRSSPSPLSEELFGSLHNIPLIALEISGIPLG